MDAQTACIVFIDSDGAFRLCVVAGIRIWPQLVLERGVERVAGPMIQPRVGWQLGRQAAAVRQRGAQPIERGGKICRASNCGERGASG